MTAYLPAHWSNAMVARIFPGGHLLGLPFAQASLAAEPDPAFPSAEDFDSHGMPDDWERKHGLQSKDAADAAGDSDGDGYTNLEEFLNSTDPAAPEGP
jgi:hypothetical protein